MIDDTSYRRFTLAFTVVMYGTKPPLFVVLKGVLGSYREAAQRNIIESCDRVRTAQKMDE